MKAVVKKKKLLLSQEHRKERMDFEIRHKDWSLKDWKRVLWSDETKSITLGQMVGNELGKGEERG